MQLLTIEELLKTAQHKYIRITGHSTVRGEWRVEVKDALDTLLDVDSVAFAASLSAALTLCKWEYDEKTTLSTHAVDTVLLRTLLAADAEFELRWDAVVGAFRGTARLFPEETTGPVRREGCIRWCFDTNLEKAVMRVAAHIAQQLVLDHESVAISE